MRKIILLSMVTVALSLTGCASYPVGSTREEIWRARYEQNIIMDDDDTGTAVWKGTKHALWDIFTLFFAEIHYARIRHNYGYYVAKARQQEQKEIAAKNQAGKLQENLKGKHYAEVLAEFGPPDRYQDDDMGGRMMIYEDSMDHLQTRFSAYAVPFHAGATGTRDGHTERKIVWFYIGKDGIVSAAGIRNATRSMVK